MGGDCPEDGVSSKKHLPAGSVDRQQSRCYRRHVEPISEKHGRTRKLSPTQKHMRGQRSQRGEGKIKAIIVTAILVIGIIAAWKVVPPYSAEYQLADKIQEIARFAVVNRQTEEQIRETVFKTIQDLEIPAKREDIKVTASTSKVTILVDYTVPVDILMYHVDLHFTPSSENKSLT